MLSWLDECNNSHPKCSYSSTRLVPLPTRVLDVSALPKSEQMPDNCCDCRELFKGKDCKLVQTFYGQTGCYAALSYCWVASLPLTTTTTNLQAHQSATSFDTLPQTLQDAILIVRWMGIEYIWIDCLCILQDSKTDWEHEAARMAHVYSNAYLTIAASRAEHCGEGFLGLRTIPSPFCVEIEDDEGSFMLYFQQYSDPGREFLQHLDSRGWSIQESLLSHRVLRFNDDQMTWGCDQFYGTEKGVEDHVGLILARRIVKIAESLSQPNSQQFAVGHWARFVESYSARQLTYDTDALPAISGIIQEIQKLTGDTYYAGLWKQHFLDGLLWCPEVGLDSSERVEGYPQTPRRRHEWIAPSWSWASIKGRITHLLWNSDVEYCACLEECSVTYCGIDPFGALNEGFTRITGPVTFITDVQAEDVLLDSRGRTCMIQLVNGISVRGTVSFDFVHHISCDVLMITPCHGIFIEKVEHVKNTYVRVGVVELWSVRHAGDNVVYDVFGYPVKTGQWRPPTTSDHVPPRSIILV